MINPSVNSFHFITKLSLKWLHK